ncbi:DUF2934 domain-containing protein [Methylorubrum extorquens]|uniref:DUF2934 domain-containing protein n=1 Tax=Methylorubrum extorquens TaxID=408 RepID=UPI0022382CD8|nr:DUF2934 domain-containing protein [Methylorubrum extorquens]UYW28252.1 DUF2934 domain-containing protein [Methylorubrum extorquens]
MPDDAIAIEPIRERAYDIWDRNHRPEGFDVEFWLMAERELRAAAAEVKKARRVPGGNDVLQAT